MKLMTSARLSKWFSIAAALVNTYNATWGVGAHHVGMAVLYTALATVNLWTVYAAQQNIWKIQDRESAKAIADAWIWFDRTYPGDACESIPAALRKFKNVKYLGTDGDGGYRIFEAPTGQRYYQWIGYQ